MNEYEKMTNRQLVDIVKEIQNRTKVSKSNFNRFLKNHYYELYAEIEKRTIKLNQYKADRKKNGKIMDISLSERIYCLLHDLDDRPLCIECHKNKVAGFDKRKNCYADYCSQYCQKHSSIQAKRGLETKKKIYGEDNVTNKIKARQTRIEKYGSYSPSDYSQKVKATKKERYGDENYVNVEKQKKTIDRLLKENPNYYYEREQKAKETKIKNGHDGNWNNREKFKKTISSFSEEKRQKIIDKRRQTCLDEYGIESIANLKSVREKIKQTNLDRYGKTTIVATEESQIKRRLAEKRKSWKYFNETMHDIIPLFTEDEFISSINDKENRLWKWKCKKCGYEFEHTWRNWKNIRCCKCHPHNFRGMQTEIEDFVRSICNGHEIRRDCKNLLKNSRQVDIYIPDLSLAIEFNGLVWHSVDTRFYSSNNITRLYHQDKSIECYENDVQLIHIFEDEWLNNPQLCKSKLKKIICPSNIKHIDRHKCIITDKIDDFTKKLMLDKYSFDGNDGSSVQYGLTYKNHLVAMMTFSKTRHCKDYQWQILNYVELNSFIVDNGFKILLDEFIKNFNPSSICLYASFDWTTKRTYEQYLDFVGFKSPRLYWIYERNRIKGTSINRENAIKLLNGYDASKSFVENMNSNKYYRIYDSGTILFEKHFI